MTRYLWLILLVVFFYAVYALPVRADPITRVLQGSVCAQRGAIMKSDVYPFIRVTPMQELLAADKGSVSLRDQVGVVRFERIRQNVMRFQAMPTSDLIKTCRSIFVEGRP